METHKILPTVVVVILMGLSFGCASGPVYQTRYDYVPPESAEGKACLEQCEKGRGACLDTARKDYQTEIAKAKQLYEECLMSQRGGTRTPILCHDPSSSIKPDDSRCGEVYNRCLANCGGKLQEKKVCVRNCP